MSSNDPQRPNAGNASAGASASPSGGPSSPQAQRPQAAAPPGPPQGHPPAKPQKGGVFSTMRKMLTALVLIVVLIGLGVYIGIGYVLTAPVRVNVTTYQGGEGERVVAIIPVRGLIDDDNAAFVRNAVETVMDDPNVRAVVLRIDSGGGMVGPSDRMYHQLARLGEEREVPVVASFGSYAASGGYYVACAADHILSEPTCITGSIGVILNAMTFEGTVTDLLKAQPIVETAETSPAKDVANSPLKTWGEADKAKLVELLNAMHGRFREVVGEARRHRIENAGASFDAVTDGSAYMAGEAKELGLVDRIGYLDDAIAEAIERGAFEVVNPPVVLYSPPKPLLEQLGVGAKAKLASPTVSLDELDGAKLRQTLMEFAAPRIMYWYPGAG